MKLLSNFFLLALLFTLLMLPLTVIDVATFNPLGAQVLSTQTYMPSSPSDSSYIMPQTQPVEDYGQDTQQSSPAVDVSKFDYYQMPSLYLGAPEGVQ